jgi:hypothetical protein
MVGWNSENRERAPRRVAAVKARTSMESALPADPTDPIDHLRFQWDSMFGRCRATALNARDQVLAEVVLELPQAVRSTIACARGSAAHFELEDLAGRHLRAMLNLRATLPAAS